MYITIYVCSSAYCTVPVAAAVGFTHNHATLWQDGVTARQQTQQQCKPQYDEIYAHQRCVCSVERCFATQYAMCRVDCATYTAVCTADINCMGCNGCTVCKNMYKCSLICCSYYNYCHHNTISTTAAAAAATAATAAQRLTLPNDHTLLLNDQESC
eukprot:16673-Heterococcus_DN1.PRE.2